MSIKNKNLINFYLSNYCTPNVTYNFSFLLFVQKVVLFFLQNCNTLNFRFTILFSFASISTFFQLGVCLLSLRCCDRPVIFSTLFHYLLVWCSLILSYIILPVSPKYFLQQEQVTLYMTPHALPLLKWFVSNFHFSDKDLVNVTSKPSL